MKKRLIHIIIFIALFVSITASHGLISRAADSAIDRFNKSVDDTAKNAQLTSGSEKKSFEVIVGGFINQILNVLGVVFFILIMYGGFLWMTAAGNESRIEKAKSIIMSSIIGLSVILLSKMIAFFIIDILAPATQ